MNYIVFDLEWNQGSKYHNDEVINFEIIEIGAVKLNNRFEEIDRFERLIKPEIYTQIHPIISNITKLSINDLEDKQGFVQVIKEFIEWCGDSYLDDYIFCTFGSQDITELQKNMMYYCCYIPWTYPLIYVDVQKIFGYLKNNSYEQYSLEDASGSLGIKQDNAFHRALDDAIYTAMILKNINIEYVAQHFSIDYFNVPKEQKNEKELYVDNHSEYITMAYQEKEDIFKREDIYITKCPICHKKCRKKLRWFSDSSKYTCIAICKEHGCLEGSIQTKKTGMLNEKYIGIKRIKNIDDDEMKAIFQRKKNIAEKRRQKREQKNN